MNEHIATYPTGQGLTSMWLTPMPSPADEKTYDLTGIPSPKMRKVELPFRRVVIGLSFDPLFVTVVGERWFKYQDKEESVHVVLAEALDTDIPAEVFRRVLELKDNHRATRIFTPKEPVHMMESLQRVEGISHYRQPNIEASARTRWPTFVDFDTTADVSSTELPDTNTITAELNGLMDTTAVDPRTDRAMVRAHGLDIPRVLFLADLPVYRTLQSVRTTHPGGTIALWLATHGLNNSADLTDLPDYEETLHELASTNSRNPTGY